MDHKAASGKKKEEVIIEIGKVGGESAQEVVWIHPCALRFSFVNN